MNITEKILARRYALAFLNVYSSFLKEADFKGMCLLSSYFCERRQACFLMRVSLLDEGVKLKALDAIRNIFKLPPCFNKLFSLLIEHKRSIILSDVFDELCNEYKKRNKIITFEVAATEIFSEEQKNIIEKFLHKATQETVLCSYVEDMSLIAGIRLQSNAYLWETSVKDRLHRIRTTFKR
ncbi:F0F1 ATP synthase subunit delta [Candidatus Babeliales bacterium]|nr:F0F1 ATP synthase subunit delta [Candidatus Babeliales bacterium]